MLYNTIASSTSFFSSSLVLAVAYKPNSSLSVLEIEKEDGTKIHLEKEHPAQQIFNASPIGAYQPAATDVPAPAPVVEPAGALAEASMPLDSIGFGDAAACRAPHASSRRSTAGM